LTPNIDHAEAVGDGPWRDRCRAGETWGLDRAVSGDRLGYVKAGGVDNNERASSETHPGIVGPASIRSSLLELCGLQPLPPATVPPIQNHLLAVGAGEELPQVPP